MATTSPIPLYHQVSSVLRQRVLDGSYPEGHQLASEGELAEEFGVCRATIRQAVGELVNQGLVARKQGRGTFVLPSARAKLGQVFRGTLADLMRETRRARVRDTHVEHDQPLPRRVAEELALEDPSGTIVRRIRTMDGETFAYTINYLPEKYGRLLSKRELASESLMAILERKSIKLASARQIVRAQLADMTVAGNLGIELGSAVLYVRRILFSPTSEPVELVESWYRGDLYEYEVTFERDRDKAGLHHNLA